MDDLHVFDASPALKQLHPSPMVQVPPSTFNVDLGRLIGYRGCHGKWPLAFSFYIKVHQGRRHSLFRP